MANAADNIYAMYNGATLIFLQLRIVKEKK